MVGSDVVVSKPVVVVVDGCVDVAGGLLVAVKTSLVKTVVEAAVVVVEVVVVVVLEVNDVAATAAVSGDTEKVLCYAGKNIPYLQFQFFIICYDGKSCHAFARIQNPDMNFVSISLEFFP
jgi:hypothetical protein